MVSWWFYEQGIDFICYWLWTVNAVSGRGLAMGHVVSFCISLCWWQVAIGWIWNWLWMVAAPISDSGVWHYTALWVFGYKWQSMHEACKWQLWICLELVWIYPATARTGMQWQLCLCRGVCGGWTACKIERGCERIYAPGTFYLWSDLEALPLFSGCCEGYGHFVILITFVCMISTLLRRFAEDSPILVGFWTALPNRWWVWRISFCFVAWNLWEMCFWSFLGICFHLVAWELATTGVFEISGRFACIW